MHTQKLVYFVRHGESEANRVSVFQTRDDVLTDVGLRQNEALAARLQNVSFDALIASPFPRARQTADAIAQRTGKTVEEDALWQEYVPPSSLLGMERDTPEGRAFTQARREHSSDPDWHYEDEENYHDLNERAGKALQSLLDRPEHTFVVVTHLGFLKVLVAHLLTRGALAFGVYRMVRFVFESNNTGITVCRYGTDKRGREGWRIVTWNDSSHLPDTLV